MGGVVCTAIKYTVGAAVGYYTYSKISGSGDDYNKSRTYSHSPYRTNSYNSDYSSTNYDEYGNDYYSDQSYNLNSGVSVSDENDYYSDYDLVQNYKHNSGVSVVQNYKLNSGVSVSDEKNFKQLIDLPDFYPPLSIINDANLFHNKDSTKIRDFIMDKGKMLQPEKFRELLKFLLYLEDIDISKEYLPLFQLRVKLEGCNNLYDLKIKDDQRDLFDNVLTKLDEVVVTTQMMTTPNNERLLELMLTNHCNTGRIVNISDDVITFKLPKKNKLNTSGCYYSVIFRPSRLTLRYQYYVLEKLQSKMPSIKHFLFPEEIYPMLPSCRNIELFNKSIYNNPEQLQAVRNIAEGPRNDAPYIIFGPPGTGKTTVLVESILQVLKRSSTKILITSQSNSACDELALRICIALKTNANLINNMSLPILRIYAHSSEGAIDTIDPILLKHSNLHKSEHYIPAVEKLHQYRIIVCTMSLVAKLVMGNFGRTGLGYNIYTHLFIDECAANTEVESLIPIVHLTSANTCVIIAGDNKQLGPVIKSRRAEDAGLGISLMDRLLARKCYRVDPHTGTYDRSIQTRLSLNFRSHPAIVNAYSSLYYNNEVKAKANMEDVSMCKNWHLLPNKEYPIIFHCIQGVTRRDNKSHSLYNIDELNLVMDYVRLLMRSGINKMPVLDTDIGIVSPYKKQYCLIKNKLKENHWKDIETGSAELFQGREKHIIIVSLVKSGKRSLGFLESSRRFNVVLSRAKSLLILVGNSDTLSKFSDFQQLINCCKQQNTFKKGPIQFASSKKAVRVSNKENKGKTEKNNNRRRRRGKNVLTNSEMLQYEK